jgi:hypothetical protein
MHQAQHSTAVQLVRNITRCLSLTIPKRVLSIMHQAKRGAAQHSIAVWLLRTITRYVSTTTLTKQGHTTWALPTSQLTNACTVVHQAKMDSVSPVQASRPPPTGFRDYKCDAHPSLLPTNQVRTSAQVPASSCSPIISLPGVPSFQLDPTSMDTAERHRYLCASKARLVRACNGPTAHLYHVHNV